MPRSKIGIAKGIPEVDAPPSRVIEMIVPQKEAMNDVTIDTLNKVITVHKPINGVGVFRFVQDAFDEVSMMDFDSPMTPVTPSHFLMCDGWVLRNRENFIATVNDDAMAQCLGDTTEDLEITSRCDGCVDHKKDEWVPVQRNFWPICRNTVEVKSRAGDGAEHFFAGVDCKGGGMVMLPVLFMPRLPPNLGIV